MLACARMGAVHNCCYGGVSAKELAERLDESNPKIIIVVSAGFEPIEEKDRTEETPFIIKHYVPILEEALGLCTKANKDCKKIIY
jgi:acyl-coenzyme A synthetase/AMP-(fatty) acid ligase